jgi:hypothetical protein
MLLLLLLQHIAVHIGHPAGPTRVQTAFHNRNATLIKQHISQRTCLSKNR